MMIIPQLIIAWQQTWYLTVSTGPNLFIPRLWDVPDTLVDLIVHEHHPNGESSLKNIVGMSNVHSVQSRFWVLLTSDIHF